MARRSVNKARGATKGDTTMQDVKKAHEGALETMTAWADANQRVLRDLAELSATTAKESVRLYAELQQSAIEAFRDAQAAGLRWQAAWQEAPRDPVAWYQRTLSEGVDSTQKAFRLIEGNAQAITRTAERLQSSAEQAGKGIQETFSAVVTKLKDAYAA